MEVAVRSGNAIRHRESSEWCEVESWTMLVCLYIGTIFCALLISEVSSIIIDINREAQESAKLLQRTNQYMSAKNLPYETRDKVREYLRLQYGSTRTSNEGEILNALPPKLKTEILLFNARDLVRMVPLLQNHTESFQLQLCSAITPYLLFERDTVFEQDSTGEEMYFIHSGVIQIVSEQLRAKERSVDAAMTKRSLQSRGDVIHQTSSFQARPGQAAEEAERESNQGVVAAIGNGCYFGDVGLFFNVKRTATATAGTMCNLYSVHQDQLMDLLDDFPDTKAYMVEVAASRLKRMQSVNEGTVREDQSLLVTSEDQEDQKTELLMVSKMLGKYEQQTVGPGGSPPPMLYLTKNSKSLAKSRMIVQAQLSTRKGKGLTDSDSRDTMLRGGSDSGSKLKRAPSGQLDNIDEHHKTTIGSRFLHYIHHDH
jgi:CRP-like cAMP-binding protein